MLGVPLATVRDELEQGDAPAGAGAVDCALCAVVDGQHVVAVDLLAVDAIADRLVHEPGGRGLFARGCRVRVAVVLDDHDERKPLDRGEVDPLVEGAGARRAVADVDKSDAILLAHLEGHRHTGHHRHHVAQRRDLPEKSARRFGRAEIAEVDVQLAAARRRVGLGHVLFEDLDGCRALHQHRAHVADERRHHVASLERKARTDGIGFLPKRAKEPADDLCLAVERDEPLLERPREAHPVVELKLPRERQRLAERPPTRAGGGAALRGRHQYDGANVCEGSTCVWSWTKNFFTLRSSRLSPIWSL